MRNLHELNHWRRTSADVLRLYGNVGGATEGVFDVPSPRTATILKVIASSGDGWDHVSVSLPNRCPNWQEMEYVKRAFFRDDETAMQLHVPPSEHVNYCETCLHLWRPLNTTIPRPDADMVAPKE